MKGAIPRASSVYQVFIRAEETIKKLAESHTWSLQIIIRGGVGMRRYVQRDCRLKVCLHRKIIVSYFDFTKDNCDSDICITIKLAKLGDKIL